LSYKPSLSRPARVVVVVVVVVGGVVVDRWVTPGARAGDPGDGS
jgi:hypothetical protein